MPARSYRQHCALARALDVVGDRWSMLIARNLLLGPQRWTELREGLPGIARNLLAARLSQLEADGIVRHDGDLYRLSPRGAELQTALFALGDWGERHLMGPPDQEDAVRLRYLMTSMRRRLRPTSVEGRLQLWIDADPFLVTLGPDPEVVQGEGDAQATVRCGLPGLRGLLFERRSGAALERDGLLSVEGDLGLLDRLAAAWP